MSSKELIVVTTAGSVDDGKSTLIGRLLYDCDEIYDDQLDSLRKDENGSVLGDDLALITDGLSAEREQGITIDVAYRYFSRSKRKFIIADVPGHEQYTRNMATGASKANIVMILVDARKGLLEQSKRHLFIASLFNITHILIVINKMDLVNYDQKVFEKIKEDFLSYANKMDIKNIEFIPVSAHQGDMVVNRGQKMNWHQGSTILSYLDNTSVVIDRNLIDFRFLVQYVVRPNQNFRGFAGKVLGGSVKCGDKIMVLPSFKASEVKELYIGDKKVDHVFNPQSALIVLNDEIDISRSDLIVRQKNLPIISNSFEANLMWFSEANLDKNKTYLIKQGARVIRFKIDDIRYKFNISNLKQEDTDVLRLNEIGRVVINTIQDLVYDVYAKNKSMGGFIVIDELSNNTVGAGIIISKGKNIGKTDIQENKFKKGALLWFTGLSGSGKSTIADAVEKKLIEEYFTPERLDGDDMRKYLSGDLGFNKEDRDKNLDRVVYIAGLLVKHNVLVLATFVSPYISKRNEIREQFDNFIEIYVNTSLEVCIKRDTKGLYKKALSGEIKNFTGINDPYEVPVNSEIKLDTNELGIEECAEKVIKYLKEHNYLE